MAQKVHDDYVAQGEKAKAELLEEAERKADAMVSEAQQQREEVLTSPTGRKSWRSLLGSAWPRAATAQRSTCGSLGSGS